MHRRAYLTSSGITSESTFSLLFPLFVMTVVIIHELVVISQIPTRSHGSQFPPSARALTQTERRFNLSSSCLKSPIDRSMGHLACRGNLLLFRFFLCMHVLFFGLLLRLVQPINRPSVSHTNHHATHPLTVTLSPCHPLTLSLPLSHSLGQSASQSIS